MALVEEDYGNNTGDERSIRRSFLVHQAWNELDAIDATRRYIVSNFQLYWPPWDGVGALPAGVQGVNELMYAANVSFAELHNVDPEAATPPPGYTPQNEYRTTVTYTHRALCPVVDYNLSTVTQKVTQAISSRYFNRADTPTDRPQYWPTAPGGVPNGPDSDNYNGAIELTEDRGEAKGADGFFPQTQFSMVWNPFLRSKFTTEVHEYARNVARMVGKTNLTDFLADAADSFGGYEADSLIFLGWTGKVIDQRNDLYEYRYQFGYREFFDANGKVIGGIEIPAGNNIGGWEHTWVSWIPERKTQTGSGKEYKAPKAQQLNYDKYLEQTEFYDLFREKANPANPYLISRLCPGFKDAPT